MHARVCIKQTNAVPCRASRQAHPTCNAFNINPSGGCSLRACYSHQRPNTDYTRYNFYGMSTYPIPGIPQAPAYIVDIASQLPNTVLPQ